MSAPFAVRIGINPLSWSNDDLPSLGGETPLETGGLVSEHTDRVVEPHQTELHQSSNQLPAQLVQLFLLVRQLAANNLLRSRLQTPTIDGLEATR